MQNVSAAFNRAIHSPGRAFSYAFTVNGTTPLLPSEVFSIDINEEVCDGSNITVGAFNKNELVMTVKKDSAVGALWKRSYIDLTVSIAGASDVVSLGRYWIYQMESVGTNRWRLTGYDIPEVFGEEFEFTDSSVASIISKMEESSGMTLAGKENLTLTEIEEVPEGATNQEILGYIAGYDEYSIRANRAGGLELFRFVEPAGLWLTPSATLTPSESLVPGHVPTELDVDISTGLFVTRADIFLSGFSFEDPVVITGLRYSDGNENFEMGSGYGIEYMNPFMTVDRFATCGYYLGMRYTPMNLPWRGNPAHQAGDSVNVEVSPGVYQNCFIMKQSISIDGGFRCTVSCYSDEGMKSIISVSPTMQKIQEAYKGMQALLAEAIDQILGRGNGYASYVYDENNVWIGLQITDSPVISETTRGWRWVYGGLYYSEDGFQTIHKTAMTADGYILGDVIAANSIYTSSLEVSAQTAVNGVNANFSFQEDGLHISRVNEDGELVSTYQALFSDIGFRVMLTENNTATLIAERDSVTANNLTANQYLRIKADNVASRFQQSWSTAHQMYVFSVFWEVV